MSTYFRLMDPPEQAKDWGLSIFRVVVGLTFMMHGWQKVFQIGVADVSNMLGQMGAPAPGLTGPLVSYVELVGGALLMVGLLSRLVAIPLAIDMLTAIIMVHLPNGYFLPMGVELVLLLFAGAVAALIGGPGALSIDRAIASMRSRTSFANERV